MKKKRPEGQTVKPVSLAAPPPKDRISGVSANVKPHVESPRPIDVMAIVSDSRSITNLSQDV
jgi:hypothetical protein